MIRDGMKYALFTAPDTDALPKVGSEPLAPETYYLRSSLRDLGGTDDEVRGWREALGTFRWSDVDRQSLIVVIAAPSSRPNVVDQDNRDLVFRIGEVWRALTLVETPEPIYGSPFTAWGELESLQPMRVRSLGTVGGIREVIQPFYATQDSFWSCHGHRPPVRQDGYRVWAEILELLRRFNGRAKLSSLVNHGLVAFMQAQEVAEIEFRIPNFVRAAEAILALGPGEGRKEFAQRGSKLLGTSMDFDPFLKSRQLDEWLRWLYDLRSECVHGKVPFEMLASSGGKGLEDAARLEYLAEKLARATLVRGLQAAREPWIFDRAHLRDAWVAGAFP